MKNSVKFLVDLSEIEKDPELKKELLKEKKPIKAAAVREKRILASTEIDISKVTDISKVAVTLEFDYPGEIIPGVYIMIGPNVPDREFLGIEARKTWVPPKKFVDKIADLSKEKMLIPRYLVKRWFLLCRNFTITGRVVKRIWRWDPVKKTWVFCDEPVPGAKVEAFDVDCWWCWWTKDLVGSAITNPDGTFEIKFRWCCLLWYPLLIHRWAIDPDLLKRLIEAVRPHVGPIPPEILKSPVDFEDFLMREVEPPIGPIPPETGESPMRMGGAPGGEKAGPTLPLPPPGDVEFARERLEVSTHALKDLVSKIRPLFPPWPCWPWPFKVRDCSPDIVFRITQKCEGQDRVIRDEGLFQTRWNIPTSLTVTLLASGNACSIPVCVEPPPGDCLKLSWLNCYGVQNIGTSPGPPDLRGYAYPGILDRPFAEIMRIRGLFGAGSDVDYFKVQYSYDGGPFQDLLKPELLSFGRSYWGPPPGSPLSTTPEWRDVYFHAEPVDGRIVYKTLKKAEEENPLPAWWQYGRLWNDFDTLFRWNSEGMSEGDGLYTLRVIGYRWDDAAKKLVNEHVMETCGVHPPQQESVMIRIDNRLKDDPLYVATGRPCGPGTIHLCTYEPDCDFRKIVHIRKNPAGHILGTKLVGPCDIIEVSNNDDIVIHFDASVPQNKKDGHLLGYHMHAHWGENKVFNVLAYGSLEKDPDPLFGPTYGATFTGSQGAHRATLAAADPERDRPYWFGGNFKVTVKGDRFETCAYTFKLRVWKRTIVHCTHPKNVHVNWCSYSFTIKKV